MSVWTVTNLLEDNYYLSDLSIHSHYLVEQAWKDDEAILAKTLQTIGPDKPRQHDVHVCQLSHQMDNNLAKSFDRCC